MQLWSEYEGRTIAGAYNLKKLLRSEGRNAFFATSDKQTDGAVIRLTEAHFDEEDMLKRWRQVAAVDQHYLQSIRDVGQTNVDDIAVAYALLEPSDGNLADVLQERPLTPAEALEVAKSLVNALSALHTNGLVHEHVQTTNILAVGEMVKLRSDCVRECVADQEFISPEQCEELRRKDVRDLGVVLLQCMTLESEWNPALRLPSPFAQMIPGAMDGSWNLERIASAVKDAEQETSKKSDLQTLSQRGSASSAVEPRDPEARLVPLEAIGTRPEPSISASTADVRHHFREQMSPGERPGSRSKWMLPVAGLLALLLLGWYFISGRTAAHTSAPARSPAASVAAPVPSAPTHAGVAAPAPTVHPKPSASVEPAAAGKGWYVVAYTYNHRNQADAKVASLARTHGALRPRVMSPAGRQSLFLVTLGGALSHQQANGLLQEARRSGLPRDTFVRNY